MDGLFIAGGVAVAIILYIVTVYNGLVRSKNQVESAWSQIDVQLKRRHDLIPNLVEVTKDAMDYEQETLTAVVEARAKAVSAKDGSREGAIAAEGLLSSAMGKLLAVFENYPDLKANQNIRDLTEELSSTENRIAFSRQHYNDSVNQQNVRVESFPSNIVAGSFGFRHAVYFAVDEAEKEPVKVDLR
ncbi:MAG: LemA family protein [Rhodospirillales bacterium]|nr:LemA family protein [Rhodospirillales bacterium]